MSTVIAFSDWRTLPPRRGSSRQRAAADARTEGADIVILPVVRIERHATALPGPVPQMTPGFRPLRSH